jgi:hypothetical protein
MHLPGFRFRWRFKAGTAVAGALAGLAGALHAGPITVPNGSFESPATFFVSLNFDSWQRTPQPASWDENVSGPWMNLTGIYLNTPPGSADHIENCDGNQAAWLFASPGAGLFQDYDSMDWNDPTPPHSFAVQFEVGKSYRLTFGLIGGGYGMPLETPLEAALYYRDAASNQVIVAATTITYSAAYFSNRTHFVDFHLNAPVVRAGDAWAGKHLGIRLLSTAAPETQGFWDVEHVRLTSTLAPVLLNPVHTNGQFHFLLQSEPGLVAEILASTNAALPAASWTSLGIVTNVSGSLPWVDTAANFDQRCYQARQVP